MSNNYTSNRNNNGASGDNSAFISRREARASNTTGALPALGSVPATERIVTSSFEFEQLIQSLRELFEHDRQMASQQDSTRCGICYLYFPIHDLHYREEGFYVCLACGYIIGKQRIVMLRKQQKM